MMSSTWTRLVVVLTARGVLAAVVGLAFWAVAPLLLGWHATTVMTGSMEPAVRVGDVVVSKPVTPSQLNTGQVLLFDDPDHPGKLRLHRFDSVNDDGTLTTRGDANPRADSTPIERSAVVGVGYLRVPFVGMGFVWTTGHNLVGLSVAGLGLLTVTVMAVIPAVVEKERQMQPRHADGRHARTKSPRRTYVPVALVALVCVLGGLAFPAVPAAAAFATATSAPASTLSLASATPATALTCGSNRDGSVTVGWKFSGAVPQRFTILVDDQPVTTATADARTATISSRDLFVWKTSTVRIRTDLTTAWTAQSESSVTITTIRILGLGRTSCA